MEVQGYADFNRWCPLGAELQVLVEQTNRAKRVRITIKLREPTGRVRATYRTRRLTKPAEKA